MDAWPDTQVPALPGVGRPLALYDTATGTVRATSPGPTARMYVCGITPYDATHIGHAATYVAFDLVGRAWRDAGHHVHYVQNVTDVDDPLLERAARDGKDWRKLAETETALFREDMTQLRVLPPRDFIGAVESIPQIVAAVRGLQSTGEAYDVDGDAYFAVHSDPSFGSVSRLDEAEMLRLFDERGGDPDRAGKKHPLDCLLWQAPRPGEPSWQTELGAGRPGWHIECTAIALDRLGAGFDVQGGGSDLVFPHHEMGASQAQVLTGKSPFAQHYVHAGMVSLDGAKMSKSKGNLVFVSTLRHSGRDPMAIRLALLAHHYRSDWEWTEGDLVAAEARLSQWRKAAGRGAGPASEDVVAGLRRHLADDLDAPGALTVVDRWAEQTLKQGSAGPTGQDQPHLVARAVDALLGVRL